MLYRIEKQRVAVSLRMEGGATVDGHIFVQPNPYGYGGQERPIDVFNSADPFVPVSLSDGQVWLVAKRRIVEVSAAEVGERDEVDELRRASARSVTMEMTLSDGTTVAGEVLLEMPVDRPRLLDFLNQYREPFLAVYTGEGARLVNTREIERVRPLD